MTDPFISICIPAYKRVEFLKRLLDSIVKDYEVIISDDSPKDEVSNLLVNYPTLSVVYIKNVTASGTPANWNNAIRAARGKWIKLMHDDDWFTGPQSLEEFAKLAFKEDDALIFSAYNNIFLKDGSIQFVNCSPSDLKKLKKNAVSLIAGNVVGPPSVILHRNNHCHFYDERLKWLVDIDFYITRAAKDKFVYIDKALVNVGIGEEQVTQSCFRIAEVEIPEHFIFLQKTGVKRLADPRIYDAWWRLFRNLKIYDKEQLRLYGKFDWPPVIYRLMEDASKWRRIISFGPASKLLMILSFLKNRRMIN